MRLKRCASLLFPILLILSSCQQAPAAESELNLGFEQRDGDANPTNWYVGGDGYDATLDSSVVHGGKYSLHLRYDHDGKVPEQSFGVGTSTFPIAAARGKKIRLGGWIRTKDVDGFAGLWLRVDGRESMLAFNNMKDTGYSGTHDWTHYSFELPVATSAININFGVLLDGHGEAWFDDLSVQLDGKDYVEPPPFEPSDGQLSWVKDNSVSIKTVDAGHGFDDLSALDKFIGTASVVGMGEATHGTSEFFRMKHRLLEYLVEKKGFTIFAIEANMPESERINEYVLTGNGDPAKLLRGIYFWTWNTAEVLDMIKWMRSYNESGKGRLQFQGFDMQTTKIAVAEVEQFVQNAEPGFMDSLMTAFANVRLTEGMTWSSNKASMTNIASDALRSSSDVLKHLEENRTKYEKKLSVKTVARMIQNARIVQQGLALRSDKEGSLRDSCMALNIDWIAKQNPGQRIAVWAHNAHVMKTAGHMGSWLNQSFGSKYVNVGFAFYEGTYTAVPMSQQSEAKTVTAPTAKIGSVEYAMHEVQQPTFFLNLHLATSADPNSEWLARPVKVRSIGAVESNFYDYENLQEEFDGLIFIDHSTHSKLLPWF